MINGAVLIGSSEHRTHDGFEAIDPATGAALSPRFSEAGPREVEQACMLADQAAAPFAALAPERRARFLESIAQAIAAIGDPLIERAMAETGLPRARLEGERGRTIGQLHLFAQVLREGSFAQVTVDPAMPGREPLPRPDLRRRHLAIGPVAVFGASNFPLAFSVAGGDTAAALAAGCPVVVKGHPAHPGTGELVARAILAAAADCGLPQGVFSFLPGTGHDLGATLVADPRIKAVGFTGSSAGGLALVRIAAARPEPIPVYAEMSSINPVLLFPGALRSRAAALATGFVQSLTMGAGQFCTNPGVVIAAEGPALEEFLAAAAAALAESQPQPMLTSGIHSSFESGVAALEGHAAVTPVARGCVGQGLNQARGALFRTSAAQFMADHALSHEVFGASAIVVTVTDMNEAAAVLHGLAGQLTMTLMIEPEDEAAAAALMPLLERKAGRILANAWPTGVEVCHAMVHGGPFPATSDSRTTSVGALAIDRFLRPVCYQGLPASLLPAAVAPENPWQLPRRVDGVLEAGQGTAA